MTISTTAIEVILADPVQDPGVQRGQHADPQAIEAMFARLRPLVYRWAWMRTGDRDDAEDVTQVVLIRAHEQMSHFEGRSSITTWLYRVTANAAAELHRRRGARHRMQLRWLARNSGIAQLNSDVVDRIEQQRAALVVTTMLEQLSVTQRCALDLVDLQGYEPSEAARMLDMKPVTLRVQLLRARRTVRKRLIAMQFAGGQ